MTDCFNCHKKIIEHSEGMLHKCLGVLSRAMEWNFSVPTELDDK